MKRKSNSLTGGTGDVKPQILTVSTGTVGAADDYVTNQVQLPVPRFGGQKNLSTIFELLWVDWYIAPQDIGDSVVTHWAFLSTSSTRADADTATSVTLAEDIEEPRNFALGIYQRVLTTSGSSVFAMPIRIDLVDGAGNGILIATDRIIVTQGSIADATVSSSIAKIGYRLVNVGVQEYVGIVQAQQ